MKLSQELAYDSPFKAREFVAGTNAVTLARDILALDDEGFCAAFRKSPMKRAKLAGLKRNAAMMLRNLEPHIRSASLPSPDIQRNDSARC